MSFFEGWKTPEERSHRNYRTGIGEPIPVTCVESSDGSEGIWRDQRDALLTGNTRHHTAPGIDRSSHPGISRTQHPTIVLNGPHPRLVEVLRIGAAVSVPSVI